MPINKDIKKVLVIGSGPIVIGQAAEFDYAGVQACRALKEENIEVVLVNSNPATIMTDENIADKVYIEPLTIEALTYIIEKERPYGIIATLGGQTGLNLAVKLDKEGILEKYNVKLLGTKIESIKKAEDRELFKNLMLRPTSDTEVENVEHYSIYDIKNKKFIGDKRYHDYMGEDYDYGVSKYISATIAGNYVCLFYRDLEDLKVDYYNMETGELFEENKNKRLTKQA